MKRYEFIVWSFAFHAVLLVIALLLPPPFPSVKGASDLTYVEVKHIKPGRDRHRRTGRRTAPPVKSADASGITLSTKTAKNMSPRLDGPVSGESEEETAVKEKPSKAKRSPAAPAAPAAASAGVSPAKPAQPVKQARTVRTAQAAPPAPPAPPAPKPRPSGARPPAPARALQPQPSATPQPPPPPPTAAPAPRFVTPPDSVDTQAEPDKRPAEREPETPLLAEARARPAGVKADRDLVSFKSLKGWPVPAMVRIKLSARDAGDGALVPWRAQSDAKWVILSPSKATAPCGVKVGVDTSRLSLGYYEAKVRFSPAAGAGAGDELSVSVMVLPREKGAYDLPHYAWDEYMNGSCKVCHLPEELTPSYDFMVQPEFCLLCHNASAMARDKIPGAGGHPMLVAAGSGGTKMPTRGTAASGPKSDRMDTHFKAGKLIVCVTCHNVMEKPGDYGRAWEMASSKDHLTYYLAKGGWENMGYLVPKVYVTDTLMKMPKRLKDAVRYIVDPADYSYDEAEGSVTFKRPLDRNKNVFVTLTEPYLRVTTQNNALCYDCHLENTHAGLNCLACHKAHGTANRMGIRDVVRTPDGEERRVNFRGRQGRYSFADGGAAQDGICEVCHPLPGTHQKYMGTDCTRCHSHKNGFGL
jgi:hypothetical protein